VTDAERRELIHDLKKELEAFNCDLFGMKCETEELRERVAKAKRCQTEVRARLAELRTKKPRPGV
jgi:hypothetical protein